MDIPPLEKLNQILAQLPSQRIGLICRDSFSNLAIYITDGCNPELSGCTWP